LLNLRHSDLFGVGMKRPQERQQAQQGRQTAADGYGNLTARPLGGVARTSPVRLSRHHGTRLWGDT
jgi:hypothetical protein